MKIFDNYLNEISDIINKQERRVSNFSAFESKSPYSLEKGIMNESTTLHPSGESNKVLIKFDPSQLTTLFGKNKSSFPNSIIGSHPDFKDIEYSKFEKHYCVSMFMDIKGSTRLNEKYDLLQIRKIKDTILTLAIHVAAHFGGHVHRLQGDGIFLQFVRKGLKEQDAIINALNAASILTHFVKTDLAEIFEQSDVKALRVRTGIDIGLKDDVIWSHYGIPGCSELTTTSLHTDLAAKLQAEAKPNGILIGGNIQELLDLKSEFCKNCYKSDNEIDYYIYQGFKNYRKFEFDWENYLRSFDFVKKINNRLEIDIPNIRIVCNVSNSMGEETYYQNMFSIPKGSSIHYKIMENEHMYIKKQFETIEWKAVNTGIEATEANILVHDFDKQFNNKSICNAEAAYKGHHHVECKIKRSFLDNIKIIFPIFVN